MIRITISIDDDLAGTFDRMIAERGYESRSEAMRDILREAVEKWRGEKEAEGYCVANFSYVYDRRTGGLAARLAEIEHEHHDLVASSTTIRLDHDYSLVSVMFKGMTGKVKEAAQHIGVLRGVRFANLNVLAVRQGDDHRGPDSHHHHDRSHLSPISR